MFNSYSFQTFSGALSISCSLAEHQPGDDPLQWLRDSIPGEPGTDYPIFSSVQETSFSCENKVFGGKFWIKLYHFFKPVLKFFTNYDNDIYNWKLSILRCLVTKTSDGSIIMLACKQINLHILQLR